MWWFILLLLLSFNETALHLQVYKTIAFIEQTYIQNIIVEFF